MKNIHRYITTWMVYHIFMYSKWYLQLAKITIHLLHSLCSIPSPPTGCTNLPINKVHISWLNWRQIYPFHKIHVYPISNPLKYVEYSHIRNQITLVKICSYEINRINLRKLCSEKKIGISIMKVAEWNTSRNLKQKIDPEAIFSQGLYSYYTID